jgi:predicted DNA-binding protein (MmcQ/YjbR family)
MNKKHWNTVNYNGSLSDIFLHQLIDHSHQLVLESLTKTKQIEIKKL